MTRRSERELERAIEDLGPGDPDRCIDVVYRHASGGEFVDADGNPTDPDPDADTIIVVNRGLVMRREDAEEEGREILGPAEDTPDDVDAVRVAREER